MNSSAREDWVKMRKTSKPKMKVREILSFVFPDGRVAEAIGIRNALGEYDPALLILGPEGFRVEREIMVGDTMFRGMDPRAYPYESYVIEDLENVKSRAELVNEIYAEVKRFVDANPKERAIITAYILLSYCPEFFSRIPCLYLYGEGPCGKTHTLWLLAYLCYRPLYGINLRADDIYFYLGPEGENPSMTILEDEFQDSSRKRKKMIIYKAGCARSCVARVMGNNVISFSIFGPKVIASERLVRNKDLLAWCIKIWMVEGTPEKDHYDREDEARFAKLRAELLKWRMAVLAGREKLPELELEWWKKPDGDLFLPLLTVLEDTPLFGVLEND